MVYVAFSFEFQKKKKFKIKNSKDDGILSYEL